MAALRVAPQARSAWLEGPETGGGGGEFIHVHFRNFGERSKVIVRFITDA